VSVEPERVAHAGVQRAVIAQRRLGRDAPLVSAVGYGGMHLSIQDRPPEEQGIRVIHAALDAGVTLIDLSLIHMTLPTILLV
jgi:predicted aldo/keto reductase-like oxidoreductase